MGTDSHQPEPARDCLHQYDYRKNRNHDDANERSRFELGPVCRVAENSSTVRQDQNEDQEVKYPQKKLQQQQVLFK